MKSLKDLFIDEGWTIEYFMKIEVLREQGFYFVGSWQAFEHLGIITISGHIFNSEKFDEVKQGLNLKMFDTLGIEILAIYEDGLTQDYHLVCICDKFEIINKYEKLPMYWIGMKLDYYKNVKYFLMDNEVDYIFNPLTLLKEVINEKK